MQRAARRRLGAVARSVARQARSSTYIQLAIELCLKCWYNPGWHLLRMQCPKIALFHRLTSDRRGATAVEFALLAPVFLLLLFGMIAYGVYFGASHSVEQIAADAARTAIAGLSGPERQSLVARFVSRNAGTYPFIDPNSLSVETADNPADSNQFVVRVRYDASGLPVWNMLHGLPLPGRTISRSSTIRIGGI